MREHALWREYDRTLEAAVTHVLPFLLLHLRLLAQLHRKTESSETRLAHHLRGLGLPNRVAIWWILANSDEQVPQILLHRSIDATRYNLDLYYRLN